MPGVEAVRQDAGRGPARKIILLVTFTVVSLLLSRNIAYAVPAAPVDLSARAPTQPTNNSAGSVYYISPSHLYVGIYIEPIRHTHRRRRGSLTIIGRCLDRYGAGRHFHSSKDPAAIFAQPTIVHQRLPHLHRSDLPLGLERPIPGHVSANVQSRGGYAWSRADHSLEYLTVRILPTSAIRRHVCVLVRTLVGETGFAHILLAPL